MELTKHWAASLDDYVIDLAWSPDGSRLAAASGAGPISVFEAADGKPVCQLPGHELGTESLSWGPALASGGQDGQVKFWDAASGQHVASQRVGMGWVQHIAWRPGSKPMLAAMAGKSLVLLGADGALLHRFKDAPKTLSALVWEPKGGAIAAAYFGGVCLWDADDHLLQKEFPYANGIHALAWSPDGRWLVSGNQDPSVHLWVPSEDIELHMSGYEGKVKHLSFDQTSRWLATSGGKDSCVWDCAGAGPEGREPAMLPHDAPLTGVAFQHAHGLLATASQDGVLMLWSPERRQPLRATVKLPAEVTRLSWSPDDQYLAIGSQKGVVYVLKSKG